MDEKEKITKSTGGFPAFKVQYFAKIKIKQLILEGCKHLQLFCRYLRRLQFNSLFSSLGRKGTLLLGCSSACTIILKDPFLS